MGQSVTCSCGQRNALDSYSFGEPRQCIACGRFLPHPAAAISTARPEAAGASEPLWADEPAAPRSCEVSGFESPVEIEGPESAVSRQSLWGESHSELPPLSADPPRSGFDSPSAVAEAPPPPPPARQWAGGVREAPPAGDEATVARCTKCRRPFRGEWDKHARSSGTFCHICATQADPNYRAPDQQTRRELYRPAPPKRVDPVPAADDAEARQIRHKKKREIVILCSIAAITMVLVNVLPFEIWMAMFFAADMSQAAEASTAWQWVIYVSFFVIGAMGHMAALYVALSLSNQLHRGGFEQNWGPIFYLGIAFQVLNTVLTVMSFIFMAIPLGVVLVGIAFVIMMIMKYMMVSERFHIGLEGFVGFLLSWFLASLMLKPCVFALHKLVHGVVAAIAL